MTLFTTPDAPEQPTQEPTTLTTTQQQEEPVTPPKLNTPIEVDTRQTAPKLDATKMKESVEKKETEEQQKQQEITQPTPETTITETVVEQTGTTPQTPVQYYPETGNAVVDAALSMLGTPYVYGGAQPGGFDCSGLTSWAYAQAGKSIPRTSGAQWSGGQAVSVNDMQPGDIVVSYGGGHVGIYIGDGQMVHSPTTGDVVKVSPLQPIDAVVRF